jgi:predicted GIY-YIG superfamily endonuclease
MTEQTVLWAGASGEQYRYWVYPINTSFKDQPGNYIYAMINARTGRWQAVYVGQTSSLGQRLATHEKEQAAMRHGATHIHAHLSGDEQARRAEETDLIRSLRPSVNEVL